MNLTGFKRKIKEATEELKQGRRNLGEGRFNILERRIRCWRHCIENLRKQKKEK